MCFFATSKSRSDISIVRWVNYSLHVQSAYLTLQTLSHTQPNHSVYENKKLTIEIKFEFEYESKASFDDTGRMNMPRFTCLGFPSKLYCVLHSFDYFYFGIFMACYGLDSQFLYSFILPPISSTMITCSRHFYAPLCIPISALFK